MRGPDRIRLGLAWVALAAVAGCVGEGQAGSSDGTVTKGGDDRTGAYDLVEHFWRPAPNHGIDWTWGSIAAVATDGPDRIFVTAWGDRPVARSGDSEGQGQGSVLRMQNLITVVDRNGNMVENWSQWDSIMTQPHRIAIDPYDPERHVWVVDLGRQGAHEQVLKFTNDGTELGDNDYYFTIQAVDVTGKQMTVQPYVTGTIDSVRYVNGAAWLSLDDFEINMADVIEISRNQEKE